MQHAKQRSASVHWKHLANTASSWRRVNAHMLRVSGEMREESLETKMLIIVRAESLETKMLIINLVCLVR